MFTKPQRPKISDANTDRIEEIKQWKSQLHHCLKSTIPQSFSYVTLQRYFKNSPVASRLLQV